MMRCLQLRPSARGSHAELLDLMPVEASPDKRKGGNSGGKNGPKPQAPKPPRGPKSPHPPVKMSEVER